RRLVIRLMDGIICQVEKERLCRMAIDKGNCLLSESISEIGGLLHQRPVFPDATIIVGLLGIEEAIELVKASLRRKQVRRERQMPFANHAGDVPCRSQNLRECDLRFGKSESRMLRKQH